METTEQAERATKQAENATKQAQAAAESWSETQSKIFDKWFETFKQASAPKNIPGFEQMRKATVDSWEASVRNTLEAQAQLSRVTVDTFAAMLPISDDRTDAEAKQLRDIVDSWTEAQAKVWSSWFEVAKKLDPSLWSDSWEKFSEAVQEAVRRAGEAYSR